MPKHLYASMTWEEINAAVQAGPVVVIPVAAIEQHGRHLPVDMDNVAVTHICDDAAVRRPDLLISAPPIHYGFNEHNMDFPGTISVQMETFLNYCADVADSFARQGFARLLFVNGHGSNAGLLNYAARKVTNKHGGKVACAAASWWDFALQEWDRIRDSRIGGAAHACELETSLYLAVRPELVQTDKIEDDYAPDRAPWIVHDFSGRGMVHFMEFWSQRSRTGVEGAPSLARAEKGERLVQVAVEQLIAFAEFFRGMELPERRDLKVTPDGRR
jgi:creatinine amidohydrolase